MAEKVRIHVRTGDTVTIISGRDKGKSGKVVGVSPKEGKVIIEGCNIVTKHMKPNKMGQSGGIMKAEASIYACKVMPVCPKCKKPTRIGHAEVDGVKKRVCKHAGCGETF